MKIINNKKELHRFKIYADMHYESCSEAEILEKWNAFAKNRIWSVGDLINALSKLDKDKIIYLNDRYNTISNIYQINDKKDYVSLQIEDGLMFDQDI